MPADAARLTIDLDAIAANYRLLRDTAGGAETAPVVKADGYGMGAGQTALKLWTEGARTFYVARLAEGEALRRALGDRQAAVLVFDGCPAGAAGRLKASRLTPVLNSGEQIAAWANAGPCALHIDTGMNRLGLTLAEAADLAAAPGSLRIELLVSHLACAAEPGHTMNARQLQRFTAVRRLFPEARASLSSSGGVFLGPDYHLDQVRPGVALYGAEPHEGPRPPRLSAVALLEAPILQVRDVPEGDSVGYGADFVTEQPLKAAILAAGYADGYLRASSPAGGAWFAGARRRLVGRISMDLIAIDVTGAAAAPGDMVELIGPNLTLDEAARAADASAYEFLVRIGRRSRRRWVGEV